MRKIPILTVLLTLAFAPVAIAKPADVPVVLKSATKKVKARSSLPVLLPARLNLDYDGRLYGSATVSAKSWEMTIAGAADCGGANACSLAYFEATKGATPSNRTKVSLRGGRTGYFRGLSCGASCSPPSIQFTRKGVLYEIQAKIVGEATDKQILATAANSALAAGPR